ncbi:ABC transporter ATP-binding protein [Lichenifustis flavocetrariae]|uniref:ATP-binding cassette domain-containing protein n=1 Tax=Lichenifustis flavocetrariae TaxID=2949735 RepID=A0AA41YV94_9HYPH|nr:ATP-binding cassette domain-containing protein [Lichenifustis flavocetrariae]MCW6509201.1 ATP-binding cassette domain-containing protein [Lichenifustis flavocetrariae]
MAGRDEPGGVTTARLELLHAEGVAVSVDGRLILAPTTLAFTRGQVVGIIGHNGSGKTTLLRCLARQYTPTAGRISLGGRPLAAWGARAFARQLAYLPQQTPASTGLTGRELVALGRYPWHGPLGRIGPQGRLAIEDAMRLADTEAFADRLVDHLSGGERQRVWIAMLIAQETGFILLDEPIAALDLAHQIAVLGVLRSLSRHRNAGIVLVLHDINMAARFCDTILALRGGAVIAWGDPAAIMTAEVLETVYGIPMRVLTDDASGHKIGVPV